MALDPEKRPRGNPNWKKGVVTNPKGKPKGTLNNWNTKVGNTLAKMRRNPVEELIALADLAKANKDYELASDIWRELQQYREAKRKPVEVHEMPTSPEESKENVEATLKMLEELNADGREDKDSSDTTGLERGATPVPPEAGAENDVQGDNGE